MKSLKKFEEDTDSYNRTEVWEIVMDVVQDKLINEALDLHEEIYPCGSKRSILDCFTVEDSKMLFWFNTADHSTHLLSAMI